MISPAEATARGTEQVLCGLQSKLNCSLLTQNLALAKLCWLLGEKQMTAALLP